MVRTETADAAADAEQEAAGSVAGRPGIAGGVVVVSAEMNSCYSCVLEKSSPQGAVADMVPVPHFDIVGWEPAPVDVLERNLEVDHFDRDHTQGSLRDSKA